MTRWAWKIRRGASEASTASLMTGKDFPAWVAAAAQSAKAASTPPSTREMARTANASLLRTEPGRVEQRLPARKRATEKEGRRLSRRWCAATERKPLGREDNVAMISPLEVSTAGRIIRHPVREEAGLPWRTGRLRLRPERGNGWKALDWGRRP